MQADRYYEHSGRYSPFSVAKALGLGLLVSVPLAFVYAYIIVYIPIVGTITFILTAGFAGVVGFAVGRALHAGKVRNHAVTLATAIPVAIFALWASWVAWVYAILHRADAVVGVLDLALAPATLWKVILLINDKGAWNLKGITPTGAALWGLWALEAAIIGGVIVLVARESVNEPFCEPCERWCDEQKAIAVLGATTKDDLVPRLERGDYAVLREIGPPTHLAFTRLDLHQCSQCQATTTLTATSVTVTVKKDKQETEESGLLKYLLVPPGELSAMKTLLTEGQAHPEPAGTAG